MKKTLPTVEQQLFQLLRIRRVEQRIADLYPSDVIKSPVHLSLGQEAIPVAFCHYLTKADVVFGTYRGHALYLAKGGCLLKFFAELMVKPPVAVAVKRALCT